MGRAHNLSVDKKYISKLIAQADDQLYYVDYLRSSKDDVEEMNFSYSDFLSTHREKILMNFPSGGPVDRVRQKYLWLCDYHNKTVRKQMPDADWAGLLIKGSDLGLDI